MSAYARRFFHITAWTLLATFAAQALADEPIVKVGAGSYAASLPPGAKGPPDKIYGEQGSAIAKRPMPTNDWWSSLAWMPLSERMYPHPLAVEATGAGLRVFYPGNNITATKDAIFGFMPGDSKEDFTLGHSAHDKFTEARVADYSDWFVTASFAEGDKQLKVSFGHGSPYVYARYSNGMPRLTFAEPPKVWSGDAKSPTLGITLRGKHYGLFAPTGASWDGLDSTTLLCKAEKDYFTLAILPDDKPATLKQFAKHAHAHVVDTKVAWKYDEPTATLTTTYSATTKNLEGASGALLSLYPHQWRHTGAKLLDSGYDSVRGRMKLIEGESFTTTMKFNGVLPSLPRASGADAKRMAEFLQTEVSQPSGDLKDTYWAGKQLGKLATLVPIAEQYEQPVAADKLRSELKSQLGRWLAAASPDVPKKPKAAGLFAYDKTWGTLIGYPASYGSDVDLNDHHFHYGYFIRAAAEVARHDRDWAKSEQFGGMIELLIRDIASPDRDDPLFPFLRNFDPYAGHSWASGHAKFGDGNNNESSSEAMNAWYGVILWGEYTGNTKLRDLGIYLYTTEMQAIDEYWFDVLDENHPPTYTPSVVTMVWGGKGANGTWFTANPEAVHGINWLPITAGSLYLGHYPEYVKKNIAALQQENDNKPWDEWADIVWMYQALANPDEAMKLCEEGLSKAPFEGGNSRANTYQWIAALQQFGQVNREITADCIEYAVFDKGAARTYVAYNPTAKPKTVTFSDGYKLQLDKPGLKSATANKR